MTNDPLVSLHMLIMDWRAGTAERALFQPLAMAHALDALRVANLSPPDSGRRVDTVLTVGAFFLEGLASGFSDGPAPADDQVSVGIGLVGFMNAFAPEIMPVAFRAAIEEGKVAGVEAVSALQAARSLTDHASKNGIEIGVEAGILLYGLLSADGNSPEDARREALRSLAATCQARCELTKDADMSVAMCKNAVLSAIPAAGPPAVAELLNLTIELLPTIRTRESVMESIAIGNQLLSGLDTEDPWNAELATLVADLADSAQQLAITATQRLVWNGASRPSQALRNAMGRRLNRRVDAQLSRVRTLADAQHALKSRRLALRVLAPGPDRAHCFDALVDDLRRRFSKWGVPAELQEYKIRNSTAYYESGSMMSITAQRTGMLRYVDGAIALLNHGVSRSISWELGDPQRRHNLAMAYRVRFELGRDVDDLNENLELLRDVVRHTPHDSDSRAALLSYLGDALRTRGEMLGEPRDLDEAIPILREALGMAAPGSEDAMLSRNNLGNALRARFLKQHTSSDDILEAIELLAETTRSLRRADEQAAACWTNLANSAGAWFEHQSRNLFEPKSKRAASLDPTATIDNQFEQQPSQGVSSDLRETIDNAIIAQQKALRCLPGGHPKIRRYQNNLAWLLILRFERYTEAADIDKAIDIARDASNNAPLESDERRAYVRTQAIAVHAAYEITGDGDLLDTAIDLLTEVTRAGAIPELYGEGGGLVHLGSWLMDRFELLHRNQDVHSAAHAYSVAANTPGIPILERAKAASNGSRAHYACDELDEAVALGGLAIALLQRIAWPGYDLPELPVHLGEATGAAANAVAAAIALGDLEHAVELFENGRLLMHTRGLRIHRNNLKRLADVDANLYAALVSLDTRMRSSAQLSNVNDALVSIDQEWQNLIEKIRNVPSFEDFLKPLSYRDLRIAGDRGPVVMVNVSRLRCDALIIDHGRLQAIPLPGLTWDACSDTMSKYLMTLSVPEHSARTPPGSVNSILDWLWKHVVEDVIANLELDASGAQPSRVWWLPSGPLNLLPLHAAGEALDKVVSSYAVSLRSLIAARAGSSSMTHETRMLIVSMATTHGHDCLPAAAEEAALVADLFPRSHTALTNTEATRERVLGELPRHSWAHFACHAGQQLFRVQDDHLEIQDVAIHNGLHLQDGMLDVAELLDLDLSGATFAFLSACKTFHAGLTIPDEAVHPAGALHLAGFRHVIASMWTLHDWIAKDLVRSVYRNLKFTSGEFEPDAAPRALRSAVLDLKRRHANRPQLWCGIVHLGP